MAGEDSTEELGVSGNDTRPLGVSGPLPPLLVEEEDGGRVVD